MSKQILIGLLLLWPSFVLAAEPPRRLATAVVDGPFIRPADGESAEPVWGIDGGMAVGLWPTSGPRGLLRIYAPYLGQPHPRMINYIAVEPIVGSGRARGLSELERSQLDGVPGKAMWSGNAIDDAPQRRAAWNPARGRIRTTQDSQTLSVYIFVERFDNGAEPIIQVSFNASRPYEVELRTFAAADSAVMRTCVLTATMGNYARLRRLHLADEIIEAAELYKDAELDDWGFLPHRSWAVDRMKQRGGEAIVAASSDETAPASAQYAAGTFGGWHYQGHRAIQSWRASAIDELVVRVNARRTYWASQSPIPGGISYENFEMEAPFRPGQRFIFSVTPFEEQNFNPPGQ